MATKNAVKGGRLDAKVVGASKTDFTIKVQPAIGHENSEQEITLPMSCWNGPGAQVGGEKLGYDRSELKPPKLGDGVIFDSSADGCGGAKADGAADDSKFHK